jgi:RNA polymerase sigma-70 factor, ECF subfamily
VLGVAELNDRLLAARAREGDRQAFQELFERHRAMLTTLIRRAGDTSGAVEDIVQETALSALIGIERLKQPDRFGAWLAGIGLNICRRQRRQNCSGSHGWRRCSTLRLIASRTQVRWRSSER